MSDLSQRLFAVILAIFRTFVLLHFCFVFLVKKLKCIAFAFLFLPLPLSETLYLQSLACAYFKKVKCRVKNIKKEMSDSFLMIQHTSFPPSLPPFLLIGGGALSVSVLLYFIRLLDTLNKMNSLAQGSANSFCKWSDSKAARL